MKPCLLGLLMLLGAQAAFGQPTTAAPTTRPVYEVDDKEGDVLRRLDRWLGAMAAADSFSGVVVVARDGKIVYSRAAGIADERSRAPITMSSRYTLASLGKMFTAVSIAQLMEQGKLSLADTVGKFLPDFPNRDVAQRVTIAQLLAHTSGLGSYFDNRYLERRSTLFTLSDYLPLFASDSLLFAPGTRFSYSNSGYIVLGRIIEAVSGMSYYEYVQRRVFDRVGMPNTGYYDRTGTTPNDAIGYTRPDATSDLRDNLGLRELRGSAAGGGYSTGADLVAFLDAFVNNRLVSDSTRALFTSSKGDGSFGPHSGAYGFILRLRGDTVMAFGHTGGFTGITTQAFYYPAHGYSLVVLLNRSGALAGPIMSETTKAMAVLRGP